VVLLAGSEAATENAESATHVVASWRAFSDAGSTPAASTKTIDSHPSEHRTRLGFLSAGFLNSRLAHPEMTKIMVEGTRLRFSLGQFKEISVPVPPLPL
jgi:hypothetical protein